MRKTILGTVLGVAAALSGSTALADGHGEITVAYFLEWPMPMMAAKASGKYDEALGKMKRTFAVRREKARAMGGDGKIILDKVNSLQAQEKKINFEGKTFIKSFYMRLL